MLDMKFVRDHLDEVRQMLKNRRNPLSLDGFVDLDERRRELLQEIRRVPGRERLPVYVVTADTSATVTCANDGFSGILIKPVTKDMLKEVL